MGDERKCESSQAMGRIPPPKLNYDPPRPMFYRPPMALIGCGGIAQYHLAAYQQAGYNIVALCDVDEPRAQEHRAKYFPEADIYTDYTAILRRDDIEVVDIATHPNDRVDMIEHALRAHKHVLSQKPFVLDLDLGERLVELADQCGVCLAVNQNGRWAPHFSYIREAIRAGLIGDVVAVHLAVHWDHSWTVGTSFDTLRHLILFDFGIHWFDILTCLMGDRDPRRVYATIEHGIGQKNLAPMLAQALIQYEGAQASIVFDGCTQFGALDSTYVVGTHATIAATGTSPNEQAVTLYTEKGVACPPVEEEWFTNGFLGTMSELLCAVEANREPLNSARDNLRSLALCFAAVASAESGEPEIPGHMPAISCMM